MKENNGMNYNDNNIGIQINKRRKNSTIKALSKFTEKEKEEFFIYLVSKDIDEIGEDNDSDDGDLEEDFQIRIFGKEFVKKNKNNCKIIINGIEEELKEFYENKNKISLPAQELKPLAMLKTSTKEKNHAKRGIKNNSFSRRSLFVKSGTPFFYMFLL